MTTLTASAKKVRVGIVNITGYVGVELARLLFLHPQVEIASVSGRSSAGKKVGEVFPHLSLIDLEITSEIAEVDIAFVALPHKESAPVVVSLLNKGIRVIDISADFRLKDNTLYPEWYGFIHPAPELLSEAVYGLPELYRNEISGARLVANPGCYPTSAILALAPLAKNSLIGNHVIIDSKSGVSGAGRSPSLKTHYCETNESISAYALEGHRHLPEIEQELAYFMHGTKPVATFVPHLTPMTRGILTTTYASLNTKQISESFDTESLKTLYGDFYQDEPFIKIVSSPPSSKQVWGSNMCLIYPTIDKRTNHTVIVSTIDNIVKGAAGQAVQNMNIMLALPETTGLESLAIYP
ncbi:MAG: N-acetyl-gamma-glutamyl-phosphate reductase [Dehalococcoidia bacterium]|nr:N-acetyl-gamma-glutamyl-phosphate reductase [Dehalococcoidia bacterium]